MNYVSDNSSSILDSLKTNNYDSNIDSLTGDSSSSFLANIPWHAWLILVVIIAVLGFSLYMYLANGTYYFENIFDSLSKEINILFGYSLPGSETAVDKSLSNQGSSMLLLNNENNHQSQMQQQSQLQHQMQQLQPQLQQVNQVADSSIKTSLFKALNSTQPEELKNSSLFNYTEDESHSSIQQSKSSSKAGWCYIGEDRGIRSCVKVNESDKCMSGNIFPSESLCINPNLRV